MSKEPLTEEQVIEGVQEVLDRYKRNGYLNQSSIVYRFNSINAKCSQNQISDALEFLLEKGEVNKRKIAGEYRYRSV